MFSDPLGKLAMADMDLCAPGIDVIGIDDDEPGCCREQMFHVKIEDPVVREVVDYIQGKYSLSGRTGPVRLRLVENEIFAFVIVESPLTGLDHPWGHIQACIRRVITHGQLVAVSASEFHDG